MARFNVSPGAMVTALRDITSNTGHGKRALSVLRDRMYDVAFRYQATYHVTTFHDQGGDTARPHKVGSSSDRRSWLDRENIGALTIQNILNAHEHLLIRGQPIFYCSAPTTIISKCRPDY